MAETNALSTDPEAFSANNVPFPRRAVFGQYVDAQLAPLVSAGTVDHRRTTVTEAKCSEGRWILRTPDGQQVVDILVLAVSHPSLSPPRSLAAISNHPKFVADATHPDALAAIEPEDALLVVGNGLTAADVIAALRRRGHSGQITAVSRRRLRSRGHPERPQEPFGDFQTASSLRASDLLRLVRAEVNAAAAEGLSWHAVLDAVRTQAQSIWAALAVEERRRIARHVRPFWNVHRFRIAPQVEQILNEAIEDRQPCYYRGVYSRCRKDWWCASHPPAQTFLARTSIA